MYGLADLLAANPSPASNGAPPGVTGVTLRAKMSQSVTNKMSSYIYMDPDIITVTIRIIASVTVLVTQGCYMYKLTAIGNYTSTATVNAIVTLTGKVTVT